VPEGHHKSLASDKGLPQVSFLVLNGLLLCPGVFVKARKYLQILFKTNALDLPLVENLLARQSVH
jgi:hypothetical protein